MPIGNNSRSPLATHKNILLQSAPLEDNTPIIALEKLVEDLSPLDSGVIAADLEPTVSVDKEK
jgi:hypothetical protein